MPRKVRLLRIFLSGMSGNTVFTAITKTSTAITRVNTQLSAAAASGGSTLIHRELRNAIATVPAIQSGTAIFTRCEKGASARALRTEEAFPRFFFSSSTTTASSASLSPPPASAWI